MKTLLKNVRVETGYLTENDSPTELRRKILLWPLKME